MIILKVADNIFVESAIFHSVKVRMSLGQIVRKITR